MSGGPQALRGVTARSGVLSGSQAVQQYRYEVSYFVTFCYTGLNHASTLGDLTPLKGSVYPAVLL